jgi:protein tyrosine phosphatase type 4A
MPGKTMSGTKNHPKAFHSNPPSLVESNHHRFLIFDAPTDETLPMYLSEWKKFNVHHLVRACDPTYDTEPLRSHGISVHDMPFNDGGAPSDDVVNKWLALLQSTYKEGGEKETIGVHCVAGLGRAPVLVAIALIEGGMNALDAVAFIRERRRGSINMKQIQYLQAYKVKTRRSNGKSCIVM